MGPEREELDVNTTVIAIVIAAAVVVVIGIVLLLVSRSRSKSTTAALRSRFGSEYDRVVDAYGHRDGEKELRARLKQRRQLDVRELESSEREQYSKAWESAQAAFVRTPSSGLRDADMLVQQVMRDRGYTADRHEDREKLVSVDYPDLVEHYRMAHGVAVSDEQQEVATEDMRRAMMDHQYLFDALLSGQDQSRATQA